MEKRHRGRPRKEGGQHRIPATRPRGDRDVRSRWGPKHRLWNPVGKDSNHQILPQCVGCGSPKEPLPFGAQFGHSY